MEGRGDEILKPFQHYYPAVLYYYGIMYYVTLIEIPNFDCVNFHHFQL